MLKTILSISGKPGLYRLLSSGKNTLIVESLQTQKRIPVLPKDRVVSLGDISMFTDGEDIALSEVLTRLHEKQAGVAVSEELLKDSDAQLEVAAQSIALPVAYDGVMPDQPGLKDVVTWCRARYELVRILNEKVK